MKLEFEIDDQPVKKGDVISTRNPENGLYNVYHIVSTVIDIKAGFVNDRQIIHEIGYAYNLSAQRVWFHTWPPKMVMPGTIRVIYDDDIYDYEVLDEWPFEIVPHVTYGNYRAYEWAWAVTNGDIS